jgi:hypothetical protein
LFADHPLISEPLPKKKKKQNNGLSQAVRRREVDVPEEWENRMVTKWVHFMADDIQAKKKAGCKFSVTESAPTYTIKYPDLQHSIMHSDPFVSLFQMSIVVNLVGHEKTIARKIIPFHARGGLKGVCCGLDELESEARSKCEEQVYASSRKEHVQNDPNLELIRFTLLRDRVCEEFEAYNLHNHIGRWQIGYLNPLWGIETLSIKDDSDLKLAVLALRYKAPRPST